MPLATCLPPGFLSFTACNSSKYSLSGFPSPLQSYKLHGCSSHRTNDAWLTSCVAPWAVPVRRHSRTGRRRRIRTVRRPGGPGAIDSSATERDAREMALANKQDTPDGKVVISVPLKATRARELRRLTQDMLEESGEATGEVIEMTIEERVAAFLRGHDGTNYCDDCLADEMGLEDRQQARNAAAALGASGDFDRGQRTCSVCGETKLVTCVK